MTQALNIFITLCWWFVTLILCSATPWSA